MSPFNFTKIYTLIVILLFFAKINYSQSHKIDSLKNLINTSKEDTIKIKLYLRLGYAFESVNIDSTIAYYTKANNYSKKIKNNFFVSRTSSFLGISYAKKGDYDNAIRYLKTSLDIAKRQNNNYIITGCYQNLASVYTHQGNYKLALEMYLKVLKKSNNVIEKARTYSNIGVIYKKQKEYSNALKSYNEALETYKQVDYKKGIASCYENIGIVYKNIKKFDKALVSYNQSLKISKEINDTYSVAVCCMNIGILYKNMGKYNEALECYKKSNKILTKLNYEKNINQLNLNTAILYMSLIDNDSLSPKTRNKYIEEALKAENKVYEYSLKNHSIASQNIALENLYLLYSKIKDYKKAFNYLQKYISTKDSLFNTEKAKAISEMMVKYETEKKENKIKLLKQKEKNQALVINHEKSTKYTIIIILILFISTTSLLIFFYIKKQRLYNHLLNKNLEIAKKDIENEKIKSTDKYSQSNLNKSTKEQLLQDLIILMEEEKYFLESQISIDKIAKMLSTNKLYLSQIINENFNHNFNNFINEYRIREARKLLVSKEYINYSLEGISSIVGFNNRTTFIVAFKKFTGVTPSFFQKNAIQKS